MKKYFLGGIIGFILCAFLLVGFFEYLHLEIEMTSNNSTSWCSLFYDEVSKKCYPCGQEFKLVYKFFAYPVKQIYFWIWENKEDKILQQIK